MPPLYHPFSVPPAGRLFCFGYGYTATVLAGMLKQNRWEVGGTHRHAATVYDGTSPIPASALEGVTAILHSIPPDAQQGDSVLTHHQQMLQKLPKLRWIGYLSTTGVYGDYKGAWVDEESEPRPASPRTKARLAAETAWTETGLPVHIFRLAGIYGQGRSVLDDLKNGTARRIYKEHQVFSRIHVEDIAAVLLASMLKPNAGRIYNVADDYPAPPAEPVEYAASLLDIAPPPLVHWREAGLSPMGLSFYGECKRVNNTRIKEELGVKLQYPTYREGLSAIHLST